MVMKGNDIIVEKRNNIQTLHGFLLVITLINKLKIKSPYLIRKGDSYE